MRKQKHDIADAVACPMEATMDIIGGKWKCAILFRLGTRTHRFNELCRFSCKLTPRTLTKQLRQLESDGLVRRTVYPQVPPKVEYDLTEKGRTLGKLMEEMKVWGEIYALNDSSPIIS